MEGVEIGRESGAIRKMGDVKTTWNLDIKVIAFASTIMTLLSSPYNSPLL